MTASTDKLNKNDSEYPQNHHDRLFAFPASTACTNFNLTVTRTHNVQLEPAKKVGKKVGKKVAKKVAKMKKNLNFRMALVSHRTFSIRGGAEDS